MVEERADEVRPLRRFDAATTLEGPLAGVASAYRATFRPEDPVAGRRRGFRRIEIFARRFHDWCLALPDGHPLAGEDTAERLVVSDADGIRCSPGWAELHSRIGVILPGDLRALLATLPVTKSDAVPAIYARSQTSAIDRRPVDLLEVELAALDAFAAGHPRAKRRVGQLARWRSAAFDSYVERWREPTDPAGCHAKWQALSASYRRMLRREQQGPSADRLRRALQLGARAHRCVEPAGDGALARTDRRRR